MDKGYFKYGLHPVFSEEKTKGVIRYYAFQWDTGQFAEDMTYLWKVSFDVSGEKENLSESEFNEYFTKLKKERGLM